jgi:antitoxin component YwqK of YwqJK toxin-antitoxin module
MGNLKIFFSFYSFIESLFFWRIKSVKEIKSKEYKEYSKEGVLLIEGKYDEQERKTGIWNEYYNTGKLAIEFHYTNGMLNGTYKSYHENGVIWCLGNYINDKKEGKFEVYNSEGKIILFYEYKNDKII